MPSSAREQDGPQNSQRNWLDHAAVWAAVVAAIGAAFAAGGSAYQAYLTRANNVVSQRAFVSVVSLQYALAVATEDRSTKVVGMQLAITNSGNTPTKDLSVLIRCVPSVEKFDEPWSLLHSTPTEHIPNFIGPHATLLLTCAFTAAELEQSMNGKLHPYLLADIQYRDRLDPTALHRTQFATELIDITVDAAKGAWGGATPVPRGRHNCADEECPAD